MSAIAKRLLIWGGLSAVCAGGIFLAMQPKAVPVDLATVATGPLVVSIDEEGRTRIRDVYAVAAPVSGRVLRNPLSVGDVVIAGKTEVARLEPANPGFLDERTESQLKAAVQSAAASSRLARAEVDRALADKNLADADLLRDNQLFAKGIIARARLDKAEHNVKAAEAALKTARAALQVSEFELGRAKAGLLSASASSKSETDCDCWPIHSPVNGRVLQIRQKSEGIVKAGTVLMEVGDPEDLEIVTDLLSADAVRVKPGQQVIIENWGGAHPLKGQVRHVEPFGITRVSALGVEEQRVNAVIDILGDAVDRQGLGHGFRVDSRIILWQGNVLKVPANALFRKGDAWQTYLFRDGEAVAVTVQPGKRTGLEAEILDGLVEGDQIIQHPGDRIADGVLVEER